MNKSKSKLCLLCVAVFLLGLGLSFTVMILLAPNTEQALERTKQTLKQTEQTLEATEQKLEETEQTLEATKQKLEETEQTLEGTRQTLKQTQRALERTKQKPVLAKQKRAQRKHMDPQLAELMQMAQELEAEAQLAATVGDVERLQPKAKRLMVKQLVVLRNSKFDKDLTDTSAVLKQVRKALEAVNTRLRESTETLLGQ